MLRGQKDNSHLLRKNRSRYRYMVTLKDVDVI
jgi:hypothetical protein